MSNRLFFVNVLNVFDCIITVIAICSGVANEGNILVEALYRVSPAVFSVVKIFGVFAVTLYISVRKSDANKKICEIALVILMAVVSVNNVFAFL